MLKSKRFNASMAAVVVLAVMLAIAIATGGTLAWFADRDEASKQFEMGGAVVVAVADEKGKLTTDSLDIQIPAGKLVPGMSLYPTIYADILQTTTPSLLRAKVDINVTAPEDFKTEQGYKEEEYDEVIEKVEKHLLDQFKYKANGWYFHDKPITIGEQTVEADNYFYFVGNAQAYSYYMTEVADTTDLNRVVKSRYAPAGEGGSYTDSKKDTTLPENKQVASILFYQLENGEQDLSKPIEVGNGIIENEVDGKIYAHVPFMVRPFILPIDWGNEVSELIINITVTFEAIQDFLVDPGNTSKDDVPQQITNLLWAQKAFVSANLYTDPYQG